MKKNLAMCALVLFTSFAFAKEDDCPSAVDAAEALNPNAYKDCDYSKSGLNGVLHKAFAKSKEEDGDSKETPDKETPDKETPDKETPGKEAVSKDPSNKDTAEKSSSKEKAKLIAASEFSTPQQLQTLKFALLEKVALECTKGFVVEGERYVPTASKITKLELIYHCL